MSRYIAGRFHRPAAPLALSLVLAAGAHAGEWRTGGGVSVGATYTDNVCRADRDKQDDVVGTVTPNVSIRGTGGRLNLGLDASVEYNTLGESALDCQGLGAGALNNRRSFVPRLRFSSQFELIENWLQLDAQAFASQNAINAFAAGGDDAINGRNNTNITYQYSGGLSVRRRIADEFDTNLRYTHSEQTNSEAIIGDSTQDRVVASIGTNPRARRVSATVRGRYSETEIDDTGQREGFTNELADVAVLAGLQLSRSFRLTGTYGEEFNDFLAQSGDLDDSYWEAALSWSPNSRIRVEVGTGERFFGETPRVTVNYRHKRSSFQASYTETVTFPRDLRGGAGVRDILEPDIGALPGDPLTRAGEATFIGNGPVQNERLSLFYGFQARRTGFTLALNDSRQTRFEDNREGTFRDYAATVTRRLGRNFSLNARLSYSEREGDQGQFALQRQSFETRRAALGVSRRIGIDTTLSLQYQYTDQEGSTALNEFSESRVSLIVRHQF